MKLCTFLNKYDYFKNMKDYKVKSIQDFGRTSKYLLEYENKYYIVLIKKKSIKRYLSALDKLGKSFDDYAKIKYVSHDKRVMVFDYYGGIDGKDLTYYHRNSIELPDYAPDRIIDLIEELHSHKADFVNIDETKNTNNWYEYFLYKITKTLKKTYKLKGITKKEMIALRKAVENHKDYFDNVETCFIHADITSVNVCYNAKTDYFYLIDFDDFMVGDPLYDYSRLINFTDEISVYKDIQERLYPDIENNIIHQFYTMRVIFNWYCYIIEKKLSYDLPYDNMRYIINKIFELDK